MNEFKKLGISLKKSDRSRYLIDMNFTDGKVFQLSTNGKTQRMGRENGILNQGGLDKGLNQLTVIRYPIKWLYGSKNDLSKKIPNLR